MAVLVGIDLGTTNIKVSAYDMQGNLLCGASEKTAITYHENGWSEFDAEAIWQSVLGCLRKVAASCGGEIASIGVSSFGESNILLDAQGVPVYPMITWFDPRTTDEVRQLTEQMDPREIHAVTGQFVSPKLGICKVMWIRRHYPEAYARAAVCLSSLDYIIYRLTGTMGMDYTMASRMMLLDVKRLSYAQEIIAASGLRAELFPAIRPSGSIAGHVADALKEQLGIVGDVPVLAGGHDHSCAAVAAHIFDDGVALDSMGTAETNLLASENLPDFDLCYDNQVSIYPHFGAKLYRLTTSIQACGVCMAWADSELLGGAADGTLDTFAELLTQAVAVQKEHRPVFCPHIRGLQEAPAARGTLFGVSDACCREDLAYAVAEGLSFEAYRRLMGCLAGTGMEVGRIRVVGGPSSLQVLMQMKADIFGKVTDIPVIRDAACLGAAVIAGFGAGVLRDLPALVLQESYQPDPKCTQHYQGRYSSYVQAVELMLQFGVPM